MILLHYLGFIVLNNLGDMFLWELTEIIIFNYACL